MRDGFRRHRISLDPHGCGPDSPHRFNSNRLPRPWCSVGHASAHRQFAAYSAHARCEIRQGNLSRAPTRESRDGILGAGTPPLVDLARACVVDGPVFVAANTQTTPTAGTLWSLIKQWQHIPADTQWCRAAACLDSEYSTSARPEVAAISLAADAGRRSRDTASSRSC